jgi:hypothetical protein
MRQSQCRYAAVTVSIIASECRSQFFHYHIRQTFKAAVWKSVIAAMLNLDASDTGSDLAK